MLEIPRSVSKFSDRDQLEDVRFAPNTVKTSKYEWWNFLCAPTPQLAPFDAKHY